MRFDEHYYTEIAASPRKGIKHLGGDDERYSMPPNDFLDLIDYIKRSNNGKLSSVNANIGEKVDGMRLIFGLNGKNDFFIESSRSGPVYDIGKFRKFTIDRKGESDPISEGYEDILVQLKDNKQLQEYLKTINTPSGLKIQTEVFYLPLSKSNESDSSLVKFVAIWYKKDKMGDWATFVVINATDGKGRPFPHQQVEEIKNDLKKLSNDKIKFETTDIDDFESVDLSQEIKQAENIISGLEDKYNKRIEDIVNNPSRKRDVLEQKKCIKDEMLMLQKEFANKLKKLIKGGKFGKETEGIIFDCGNDIIFKIVSDKFKEAKKAYNRREE